MLCKTVTYKTSGIRSSQFYTMNPIQNVALVLVLDVRAHAPTHLYTHATVRTHVKSAEQCAPLQHSSACTHTNLAPHSTWTTARYILLKRSWAPTSAAVPEWGEGGKVFAEHAWKLNKELGNKTIFNIESGVKFHCGAEIKARKLNSDLSTKFSN